MAGVFFCGIVEGRLYLSGLPVFILKNINFLISTLIALLSPVYKLNNYRRTTTRQFLLLLYSASGGLPVAVMNEAERDDDMTNRDLMILNAVLDFWYFKSLGIEGAGDSLTNEVLRELNRSENANMSYDEPYIYSLLCLLRLVPNVKLYMDDTRIGCNNILRFNPTKKLEEMTEMTSLRDWRWAMLRKYHVQINDKRVAVMPLSYGRDDSKLMLYHEGKPAIIAVIKYNLIEEKNESEKRISIQRVLAQIHAGLSYGLFLQVITDQVPPKLPETMPDSLSSLFTSGECSPVILTDLMPQESVLST